MGTNNKTSPSNERTYFNNSPSNKKNTSGPHQPSQQFQRPSPSKSINIRTPNKTNSAGLANNGFTFFNNNNNYQPQNTSVSSCSSSSSGNSNAKRLSGSCSPPNFSFFAGSKCFESPSPQSLPKPPTSWFHDGMKKKSSTGSAIKSVNRVRKSLNMNAAAPTSCAAEFVKQQSFSSIVGNDPYTQHLKLVLNVNA
jgi:hypothetical protein